MALDIRSLVRTVSIPVTATTNFNGYEYATADAAATVLAAGYFNGARDLLKVGDRIQVAAAHPTSDFLDLRVDTIPVAPGNITVVVNTEASGT